MLSVELITNVRHQEENESKNAFIKLRTDSFHQKPNRTLTSFLTNPGRPRLDIKCGFKYGHVYGKFFDCVYNNPGGLCICKWRTRFRAFPHLLTPPHRSHTPTGFPKSRIKIEFGHFGARLWIFHDWFTCNATICI